jgi:uncharacterized RDD family membrane protein YckC
MDPIIDNDFLKNEEKEITYATLMPRFWAMVVDGFVMLPITIPFTFLNILYWKSWPMYLVGSLLTLLYKPFCEYKYGMTVGKKVMKLRVLSEGLEKINLPEALSRNIFNILPEILTIVFTYPLFGDPEFLKISSLVEYSTYMQSYTILERLNWTMFPVLLIEIVFVATDPRRRSLHDRIARTVVVKSTPSVTL